MEYSPPPLFKQGPSALARLIFFVVLAIALLISDARFNTLEIVRGVLGAGLYPLQRAALVPRDIFMGATDLAITSAALRSENQALADKNLELSVKAGDAAQLEHRKSHFRACSICNRARRRKRTPAEVQYDTRDPFTQKVVIGKGAQQGIQDGAPVVNEDGVIGQVTRVFPLQSEVTLLSDKDQAVPVQIVRTGLRSAHALVLEAGRQAHVDHAHVGAVLVDGGQEGLAVGDRGDDLEAVLVEQRPMPLAQQRQSSAITTRTGPPYRTVGPPLGEAIASVPSSAARRLCRPSRPWPAGSAPPGRRRAPRCAGAVLAPDADLGAVRLGVLDGVGQRLGDGEVGGQLDRGGQAPVEVDLDPGGQRRARGQRADGLAQAALGEQRGADPAGEVAQLAHRELGLAARLLHELARALGVAVEALLRHAQVEGEGDEPRLRAVVEVALDAVQLGGGGVDGAGARLGQDLDALLELAAARAEHDPRQRAAGGRSAAHQRRRDGQQDDADGHGQEGVAPRVDLEEPELGGV